MASEDQTTEDTSGNGDAGVHRLRDIVAEEVSLVDRAANKRRFLVVKRSGQMADDKKDEKKKKKKKTRQQADAAKARTRATRAASEEEEDDDEETEKARGQGGSEGGEDDEEEEDEAEKARGESDDEEDDEEKQDDDEEEEDEEKADDENGDDENGDDDDDDEDDDDEDEEKAEQAGQPSGGALVLSPETRDNMLRVLAQALEQTMLVANQVKRAGAPGAAAKAAVPASVRTELARVGKLLGEVGEQFARTQTTKAGRRMAKSRLERFQKALELLSAVLKELTEERAAPAGRKAPPKKRAAKGDATAGLPELVASVKELSQIVKGQQDEIVKLAKARATSNAIPIDGGSRRRQSQEVSWPLDMNAPIARDKVDKSISFYDD